MPLTLYGLSFKLFGLLKALIVNSYLYICTNHAPTALEPGALATYLFPFVSYHFEGDLLLINMWKEFELVALFFVARNFSSQNNQYIDIGHIIAS